MKRALIVAIAACLHGAIASPAIAQNCPSVSDGAVAWRSPDFFGSTPFSTVGFSLENDLKFDDRSKKIYVPKDGVRCISLRLPVPMLQVVFNNRHANFSAVGYVSFKLYAYSQSRAINWTRFLDRSGTWSLRGRVLPEWKAKPINGLDASTITDFEKYYDAAHPDRDRFEAAFGDYHAKPTDLFDSWSDLRQMQPADGSVDLARVGYVSQAMQRYEVVTGALKVGKPPNIETDRYRYFDNLLVHYYTPLQQGEQGTITFQFSGRKP